MPNTHNKPCSWWQPQELAIDACRHYRLGPLNIYLQRQRQQWLLAHEYSTEDMQQAPCHTDISVIPLHLTSQRYLISQSPASYQLLPRLMDRPVVVKTLQPVNLPPNEQTTLYISSPVTVRAALRQPDCPLQDIAVTRLSDTWFGPSTQIGELCYADKTHARHSLAEIPARPHRAVTPITIENHSTRMLTIDKLSIPLPYLALYGADDGSLWTDPITLQHENLNSLTRFQLNKQLPRDLTSRHQLAAPVHTPDKHGLVRAFTGIFNQ